MNRRFLAVLAATSIAVALLAAVSVAFRAFEAEAAGRKAASADFETLRYSLSSAQRLRPERSGPARSVCRLNTASVRTCSIVVYERGAGQRVCDR